MKVLLVSPLPPPVGGIASWTVQYDNYCKNSDINVFIVNTSVQNGALYNKSLINQLKRTKRILKDLKVQIKADRPDIVHINTSCARLGLVRDLLCANYAKKKQIPYVLHCHCNVPDQIGDNKISKRLFTALSKKASRVMVLNAKSREYARALVDEAKISTIPNFISAEANSKTAEIRPQVENIIFVGHVHFKKGIREIYTAAKELPDCNFTIIGPVSPEVEQLQPLSNVHLLGAKTKEEVFELLCRSDIFLFPSYTEGFSVAMLEAMSAGLPVIASDVGANRDMIEDSGGIIIPPKNSAEIVSAVKKLNSYDVRKKMQEWNKNKVIKEYTEARVTEKLFDIYRQV